MNPAITLAQRIRRYRRNLGMNQTEFGARFGVTRLAVGNWEHGTRPNSTHLPRILEAIGGDEADHATDYAYRQLVLPFDPPIEFAVKMSPQAADAIHFEVRIRTKAS